MVTEQSASKLPEMIRANGEVPVVAAVAQLVCAMRRERWPCCARYRPSPVHSSSISSLFIYLLPFPRPPLTLSCPAALLFTELVTLSTYCTFTIFPLVIGRTCRHHFFFSLTSPFAPHDMFTHAPGLVQQRPAAPTIYERTPSYVPPLVPRSRAPSLRQSPAAFPFPTRQNHSTVPQPVPAARPNPEPWVDALKDDVETEFNLTLVDDMKAQKDATLAVATTVEERAAIQREYAASMADIRAQARAEFQRRVEAERERRLQGNYHGKDALIAEQHNIMEGIARENMRREASQSSTAQSSTQAQSQLGLARPSQPIPIPVQRSRSRNGGPSGSIAARSVSNTSFPLSSSSSSPRPFPTVRRDSITHYASPRLLPPPVSSPATSVSSISSSSEPSSSHGSSYSENSEMDRRYEEHRAIVQRREEEVRRKEAAARRSAEEARRREEAAARHEEDAKRKNEEATRRIHEAELREQQVRAWEARTRKEMELAQKEAGRARSLSQSQSAAIPLLTRVFSKPRTPAGAMAAPNREAKVRA
jgi:hypothetical protein